jgi:hypothetical protein
MRRLSIVTFRATKSAFTVDREDFSSHRDREAERDVSARSLGHAGLRAHAYNGLDDAVEISRFSTARHAILARAPESSGCRKLAFLTPRLRPGGIGPPRAADRSLGGSASRSRAPQASQSMTGDNIRS